MSGGAIASFIYNALGRRMRKSIAASTTAILYDGFNPVQELDASDTPSANLLTGAQIDEYFQRSDSVGARSYLSDNLGSTLALTDATGAIQTQYAYEPFGNTTTSGASSFNSYQYTGRENDATGLYYYRARYYSPTLQRFIAQDPIGFGGGYANLYAYSNQDPIDGSDPLGLCKKGRKPCFGIARVLHGNPKTIGHQGGIPNTPIEPGTGAIAPEQFGYEYGGQVGASLASQISGSFTAPDGTTVSFNGVTDVIGRPQSEVPPPFDNVRDFLMDQYPGQFLLELPDGSKDYGSVPITLWVPSSVPCPSGTWSPAGVY